MVTEIQKIYEDFELLVMDEFGSMGRGNCMSKSGFKGQPECHMINSIDTI